MAPCFTRLSARTNETRRAVLAFGGHHLSPQLFFAANPTQVMPDGEVREYQHPGFLAFLQAFLFDTAESLGAANPGLLVVFKDGLIALGATFVSIRCCYSSMPLTGNCRPPTSSIMSYLQPLVPRSLSSREICFRSLRHIASVYRKCARTSSTLPLRKLYELARKLHPP